jgi:hypothetical protein
MPCPYRGLRRIDNCGVLLKLDNNECALHTRKLCTTPDPDACAIAADNEDLRALVDGYTVLTTGHVWHICSFQEHADETR